MHKMLRFKADDLLRHNIRFFKHFVKQFLCVSKRLKTVRRSALFLIVLCSSAFSGFEDLDFSVRPFSVTGAVSAVALGAESFGYNPAGLLTSVGGLNAAVSFGHPFELNELALGQAALVYGRGRLAIGGGIQHFGNPVYRENQFSVGTAYRLPFPLIAGIVARYGALSIQNYGQDGALMIDLGLRAELSRVVSWGAAVKNVNRAVIGRCREPLPQSLSVGFAVQPRNDFQLLLELNKDVRFKMDLRCGLAYQPLKALSLRAGVADQPRRFALGFSIHLPHVRFDYGFGRHWDLGDTHMAAIAIE